MPTEIVVALIGAVATIAAAVLARTEIADKFLARNPFPSLAGVRLLSRWTNVVDGKPREYQEIIEIQKQRRGRVYGIVTMAEDPRLKWAIEGDYNGRFLRLFWHATHSETYLDHGCYFFEKKGRGFVGYSVGYDARLDRVTVDEHKIEPLS